MRKEYKCDPTDSGRLALSLGLVCPLLYYSLKTGTFWFALYKHCWPQLVISQSLKDSPKKCLWSFCGLASGLLDISALFSGLNNSCWFVPGVYLPRGLQLWSRISCLLCEWTPAIKIKFVPKELLLNKPTFPITFLFHYLFAGWWAKGRFNMY